ncbi:MAG: ABC transporter substrate-binding protein [Pseudonocardiaceae bacterium]|nr:ABC transporter substrate-binding protein [Pseudonocardiaceae bacterium]
MRTLDRRRFLIASAAAGATAALAACGYRGDEAGGTAWSFTDDRRRKVTAGKRPKRIVAQVTPAAALWDFGIHSVGIFGPSKLPDGKQDPQSGSVDLAKTTSLGNVWGEFNYDKYVSLNPELLVSVMYLPGELWYVPKQQAEDIEKAAPTIGLSLEDSTMPQAIAKFEKLAGALGADLKAGSVTSAKRRFEQASAEFGRVAKRTSKLRVMAVSVQQDQMYVGNPSAFPTTRYYVERGMNFVVPDNTHETGYYEELSWENADRYHADVIMYDDRFSSLKPKDVTGNPTWSRLPAVRAGRLIPWNSEPPLSYRPVADLLTDLSKDLVAAADQ